MDDEMTDYDVQTTIRFRLNFDGSGELNLLSFPEMRQEFAQHVKKVFEQNEIGDKVFGDLHFHFDNQVVWLEYTFCCHDASETEAESFSTYCVRDVQKELEAFGCSIMRIDCKAEESDLSWLDALEDKLFAPRQKPPKPVPSKPSQKRGSQKTER